MRRADRHIRPAAALDPGEVETMELHPLDELSPRLRLERGQGRVAQRLVGIPVAGGNRVEQPAGQCQEFLLHVVAHVVLAPGHHTTATRETSESPPWVSRAK